MPSSPHVLQVSRACDSCGRAPRLVAILCVYVCEALLDSVCREGRFLWRKLYLLVRLLARLAARSATSRAARDALLLDVRGILPRSGQY